MEDHGDDDRERSARVVRHEAFPDAEHVAQEPQGHEGVDGALMLEEEIEKCILTRAHADAEKQVRIPAPQMLVDEASRNQLEGAPIDLTSAGGRMARSSAAAFLGFEKTSLKSAS
jgi:hypothetical protein